MVDFPRVGFIVYRNSSNYLNPFQDKLEKEALKGLNITLSEETSFLNKGSILQMLNDVPANAKVVIDATRCRSVHNDIVEIVQNFLVHAKTMSITAEVRGLDIANGTLIEQNLNQNNNENVNQRNADRVDSAAMLELAERG